MKRPPQISSGPGVYIFRARDGTPLYIGKAGNLKKRLAFYFSGTKKSPKLIKLLEEAKKLEIIETASEIEALIKEAELIKKYLPKYNVLMRDDKSYFFIGITKEQFSRIFIMHRPIKNSKFKTLNPKQIQNSKFKIQNFTYIGPFTDGNALKITLRLLRRVFPYCTCKEFHKRPCLNAEIGRCPGFCCYKSKSQITNNPIRPSPRVLGKSQTNYKKQIEYQSNIQNIMAVFQGKKKRQMTELKREMAEMSKKQEFEKAAIIRDQIYGLKNIFEHRQLLRRHPEQGEGSNKILRLAQNDAFKKALQKLLRTNKNIKRIEGYDISNISGQDATGSMVVFVKKENGTYTPDKSKYRKFKIKTVQQISDVDMMREVIQRRFNHSEWSYPDLIIVDGGKPQLSSTVQTLLELGIKNYELGKIIITALAKQNEELYIAAPLERGEPRPLWRRENRKFPIYLERSRRIKLKKQPKEILHLFQSVRDESHRFAKKYHHKLREKKFNEESF